MTMAERKLEKARTQRRLHADQQMEKRRAAIAANIEGPYERPIEDGGAVVYAVAALLVAFTAGTAYAVLYAVEAWL